jgi:phosphonate metabolism protein PhnN/1,5-bisphosphokinase (PRPP-forming)
MLVLVVGPSGAGKDALMKAAREVFRADARISFARRVITRPADPEGENHEPVTEDDFAEREFALSWSAHGLRYGIPKSALDATVVVANVSRGVIGEAASRYAVRVIEVNAPPEILAARLAARGRESAGDVARRLGRTATIPSGVAVTTVWNDGTLAEGADRFVAAIRDVLREATEPRRPT